MTILLNFGGTFNSFETIGMDRAATGLPGDVIDGIVTVSGVVVVAAAVALTLATTFVVVVAAIFFVLSVRIEERHLGEMRRENERINKT